MINMMWTDGDRSTCQKYTGTSALIDLWLEKEKKNHLGKTNVL